MKQNGDKARGGKVKSADSTAVSFLKLSSVTGKSVK